MKEELLRRIHDPNDPLRLDLAGDMTKALTTLPDVAAAHEGTLWCALYEFEDKQLIEALTANKDRAQLILSNTPGKVEGEKTNDDVVDACFRDPKNSRVLTPSGLDELDGPERIVPLAG